MRSSMYMKFSAYDRFSCDEFTYGLVRERAKGGRKRVSEYGR